VGRGAEKSFCILLTSNKINKEASERLSTMVSTTDGFKIAEKDLELRGPGDIEGTRQSGELNFRLANLLQDKDLLILAKETAENVLDKDPDLMTPENLPIRNYLKSLTGKTAWSKIS
jgi:ATP-dependent DNA helicase RecG